MAILKFTEMIEIIILSRPNILNKIASYNFV